MILLMSGYTVCVLYIHLCPSVSLTDSKVFDMSAHQHIQENHISSLSQSIRLDSRSQSNTRHQRRPIPFQDNKTVWLWSKQELAE